MGRKALINVENFLVNSRAQAMSYIYLINDLTLEEVIERMKTSCVEPDDLLPDFIKAHFTDRHMIDLASITNNPEYRYLFKRVVDATFNIFLIYAVKYYRDEMTNMSFSYELPEGSASATKLKDEEQDLDFVRSKFCNSLANQSILFTDMVKRVMRHMCLILNIIAEREIMKSVNIPESELPKYEILIRLMDGDKTVVATDLTSSSSMEEIANALSHVVMIEGMVFNKTKLERVAIDENTSILLTVDISEEHKYRVWKLHDDDTTLVLTD